MKKIAGLFLTLLVFITLLPSYAAPPLNQPAVTTIQVKAMANEAFKAAYSFDFLNYKKQQAEAARYFTPEAWKTFQAALMKSGLLNQVFEEKLVTTGLAESTGPIVLSQELLNGTYGWLVTFPATITLLSDNATTAFHYKVSMRIMRANEPVGVRGLIVSEMSVVKAEQDKKTN